MKQLNAHKQRHSGFTLLEMVVVIAIISILLTVLVPTMRGYLIKSRLNTANSEAKVLYNSIQTVMQEYEFRERQMSESVFYGSGKSGSLFLKGVNGTITAASSSTGGSLGNFKYTGETDDMVGTSLASAKPASVTSRLSRLYSDYGEVAWAAYIEDYGVRGVFCATDDNSVYVGGYPTRATVPVGDAGCETGVRINAASSADLAAYSSAAWSTLPKSDS